MSSNLAKIMKPLLLATISTLTALLLPGCLQSETTIHLQKDGSGTLVEQTTLGAQMLGMLPQMAAASGGEAKDPLADMFSMEKANARAAALGDGVTVEKSTPFEAGGSKGASTTYRFADINKLKISAGDAIKSISPAGAAAPADSQQKPITFAYTAGTLTVAVPEPEKPAPTGDAPPAAPEENPQMEALVKQMLGDMKISMKLVIEPGIAETDATHRDANTITLAEIQMAKVIEKPESLKKLSSAPQDNPAAAMELLKNLDGVKIETKPKVTVKLK
jgi:hypothetical protein